MLHKKGIVRKTFLFSVLLIVLVTLISFLIQYFAMPRYYLYKKEQNLRDNLHSLTQSLREAKSEEDCAALIAGFSEANNVNILSFDRDETLLPAMSTPFVSMQGAENAFFSMAKKGDETGEYSVIIQNRIIRGGTSPGERQEYVTFKIAVGDDGGAISLSGDVGTAIIDHVMVSGTLQPIDEAKDVILALSPYVLCMGAVVGLLLSWIYARQISKPILRISDAAVKMQRLEPEAYSGIRSDDELGLLSRNLDTLYSSLREHIESLRDEMEKVNRLERSKTEMMQSASHELKTPITALGGMLEGMIDGVGPYRDRDRYLLECKEEVDKLSALVGEILSASRSEAAEGPLQMEEIALDELVGRVVDEYGVPIANKRLQVEDALFPTSVTTDPSVLYRALSNIISNAVRYTPSGGTIRIGLSGEGPDRWLSIENQCAPVPEEALTKLTEPFYTRSYSRDKAESGTGLGMYIVKRNLERLGISYTIENGDLGLKICLRL